MPSIGVPASSYNKLGVPATAHSKVGISPFAGGKKQAPISLKKPAQKFDEKMALTIAKFEKAM